MVRLEAMAFKDGFEGAVVKESDEQGVAWLRYLAPFSDSPCLSPDRDQVRIMGGIFWRGPG